MYEYYQYLILMYGITRLLYNICSQKLSDFAYDLSKSFQVKSNGVFELAIWLPITI